MNKVNPGFAIALSGGMDSAVTLAHAVNTHPFDEPRYAYAFDYGQKHRSELGKAKMVADYFNVPFAVIELPKIFSGAGSSLMDADVQVEALGSYDEIAARFGSQPTVVPNRNMMFISCLITLALTRNVGKVYLGVHAGDHDQWHYPDCSPGFVGAMTAAAFIGNDGQILLDAPFIHAKKSGLVLMGAELNAPLHMTQSCYNGQDPACGTCSTCIERIQAFEEAGYEDPIPYRVDVKWTGKRRVFPWKKAMWA